MMKYYSTPIRMTKKLVAMPNANKNKDKLNLIHCWWDYIMVQPLWIIVW